MLPPPKFVPVIMAGGSGQRFWPLSTAERPKQFLDLERSGRSLLQATFDRLVPLAGGSHYVFVVTGERYADLILEHLPDLPQENLLLEPCARNTAPAIALAALELKARFGDVMMGLFPSDHRITRLDAFTATLTRAIKATETNRGLTTLGIRPTHPATGYGYILQGEPASDFAHKVERFVEKPDLERAKRYLETGNYSWNGGIFLWYVDSVLSELRRYTPELMLPLTQAFDAGKLADVFEELPSVSIDYALLEKTTLAQVVPADFDWDDLGDWLALERLLKQDAPNTVVGKHVGIDTLDSIIYTTDGDDTIITIGLEDVVIVKRDNMLLVARKDRVQDIKKALELMETA